MSLRAFIRLLIVVGVMAGGWGSGALGAVGDRLSIITPVTPGTSGNGRGLEIPTASRTAWYSTSGSGQAIFQTDVATNTYQGSLTTTLSTSVYSFGALAWDSVESVMWGSEYSGSSGWIDRINPASGAVTRVFDAKAVFGSQLDGVDGLTVDSDGTLWMSGDGINWPGGTRVVHASKTGTDLGGEFTAPFGNSGIIADTSGLWLVDHQNGAVHLYSRAGAALGVSFPTTGLAEPEDGTLDTCTFPGKKALWIYQSMLGGSGQMAAYEVGPSDNSGCPPAPAQPATTTPGSSGALPALPEIRPANGTGGTDLYPGARVVFLATSALDPTGTLYVYRWDFGDGTRVVSGRGRITRRFACPGFYRVRVTVLTSVGGRVRITAQAIVIQFSRGKIISANGLRVLPFVVPSGNRVRVALSTQKVTARAPRVTETAFAWDHSPVRTARRPLAAVTFPRGRVGRHTLRWGARFSRGGIRRQSSCLWA